MRYRKLDPTTLTPKQKNVYDAIVASPRGSVPDPLAIWLAAPGFADRSQQLGAYCRCYTSLDPRLSELVILINARHWRAIYEWEAHEPIARRAGVSDAVIEAIRTGDVPKFGQADEECAYWFVTELLDTKEVSPERFAIAHELFGQAGIVDLIGITGYYSIISMTIKAFEIPKLTSAPAPF